MLSLLNFKSIIAMGTVLAIVSAFLFGWNFGADRVQARWEEAKKTALNKALQESTELEKKLNNNRENLIKNQEELTNETKKDIYSTPLPADGVRIHNNAWSGSR